MNDDGITGAVIGAVADTINNGLNIIHEGAQNKANRDFQSSQAEINRNFQERMRDTAFISSVNQAKKLGISPSLLLGHSASASGGSTPSGGSSISSRIQNPLANSINQIFDLMKQDRQLDTMERLQDEKIDALKEMQNNRINAMSPSVTAKNKMNEDYKKTNFSKKFLDSLITDLDNAQV